MKNNLAENIKQCSEQQLLKSVAEVFAGHINNINSLAVAGWFPLTTTIAAEQTSGNCVLIGNAAHTIYPLAAQGFNLGLRDAAVLADVLQESIAAESHSTNSKLLNKYLDWRKADQQKTIALTRSLEYLFDCRLPMLGYARGISLLALDMISPLKKCLAKQAMGITGKQPRLLRGIALNEFA